MTTFRLLAGVAAAFFAVCTNSVATEARDAAKFNLEERLSAVMKDTKTMEAAASSGKKVIWFCANCHGEGGNSKKPEIPNLAGQNPAYLLEQVKKFSDGRRRNEFMEGMIKALNDEEKVNIVAYFVSQEVKPHATSNSVQARKGHELFLKICQRCHGEQGRGNEKIPRIAGQQPAYLALSLKRYRDGTGERIDPYMAANTKMLSDDDINTLVAYVSGMK